MHKKFPSVWNNSGRQTSTGYMQTQSDELRMGLLAAIPQLRRFAYAITKSPADADDLMQATLQRALERPQHFRDAANPRPLLFRMCRTIWIDEMRKQKVRRDQATTMTEGTLAGAPAMTPDGGIQLNETQRLIMALPQAQREVLLLVAVEGYSYREAGDMLDCPEGTIMSRLARARSSLANALHAEEKDQ